MNQQQSPTSNQPPNSWSSFLIWVGVILFTVAIILAILAFFTNQDILISFISFLLTLFGVIVSIKPILRNIFSQVRRTIKTGLVILSIALLIISITLNFYQFIHPQASATSLTPVPESLTTTPLVHRTLTSTNTPPSVPTLVQKEFHIQNQDTTSSAVSLPSSVTTGDLIIVAITQFKGAVLSVMDNQGNSYIQVTSAQHANSASDYVQLYYAKNATGGATTLIVTFSISGGNLGIYEYSGINTTSPLDQVVSNTGTGVTPDGGTLNTTNDNELYFVVGVDDNGDNIAPSAGNGYTLEDHEDDSSNHERFYSEDRISAHGSYQTDFSISSRSSPTVWAIIGAAFKPA